MKWGYLLIGVSVLILIAVLYGQNRRREEFTNMKGNFPNWATLISQVKSILDKHYEYDATKLAELSTKQHDLYGQITGGIDNLVKNGQGGALGALFEFVYGMPSAQLINDFNKNKDLASLLPKGTVLNVDTPFDTRMAMIYAVSEYAKKMVKKAKNDNDILGGYSLTYATAGASALLKNMAMPLLIGLAFQATKAKLKPSDYTSAISK
uniref:Uncharacterized protein n=1 Tax=viral metagenome TaxID=1070528 RepID=A0A6C0AK03_9ZZZZ